MHQDKGEFLLCSRNGLAPSCLLAYSVICQHFGVEVEMHCMPGGVCDTFLSDPHKSTGHTCHQASRSVKAN